jgi:hypothetical protein
VEVGSSVGSQDMAFDTTGTYLYAIVQDQVSSNYSLGNVFALISF